MSLTINYNDITGLNLYALIFKDLSNALDKSGASGFLSYSDSNIDHFNLNLSEVVGNSGVYTGVFSDTSLNTNLELKISIFQRTGATPNKTNDLLKASNTLLWNGIRDASSYHPVIIRGGTYLGTYDNNSTVYWNMEAQSPWGNRSQVDNNQINYRIIHPTGAIASTGFVTGISMNSGYIYRGNLSTAGLIVGNYRIENSGIINSEFARTDYYFTISTGISVNATATADVLSPLGYATGYCNDPSATTTSFTTTLAATGNAFYCGQILRFTSGPNVGQGRIVSAYSGATRTIYLNKALNYSATSGSSLIIFPLGGELGVS